MALHDPIAAYNAANNIEAHLVCHLLIEAGIEAIVIEDVSQVGVWWGGTVSEIHKPQVWIERTDVERARPLLTDYDRRSAERRLLQDESAANDGELLSVTCEKCGKQSQFSASLNGTVQVCPHCRGYLDVGDSAEIEGWDVNVEEGSTDAT